MTEENKRHNIRQEVTRAELALEDARLINQHFVRTGQLAPDVSRCLTALHQERQDADYDSAAVFDEQIADEDIRKATRYGEAIRRILIEGGNLEPEGIPAA